MTTCDYGRRVVVDVPFERALAESIHAFRAEGLHLLSRVDVREFLERTCQHDFRRYVLLDVAPAQTMLEALLEDFAAGAVVPTRVAVFELADGETAVFVAEPFSGLASDAPWRSASPGLAALADRTSSQLARALDRLEEVASHRKTAGTEAFVM